MKIERDGQEYQIKIKYGQRFIEVVVEDLQEGDVLDQGTFLRRTEAEWGGAVNPRTWEIHLRQGIRYVESRGAKVRVWI